MALTKQETEELQLCIHNMKTVASHDYSMRRVLTDALTELRVGQLLTYIHACEDALEKGIDFRKSGITARERVIVLPRPADGTVQDSVIIR